jgi:hypothetical protein
MRKALVQSLPVLSVFVFWLAGTSFGYVPIPVVVLSGTASLEGGYRNPISSFAAL